MDLLDASLFYNFTYGVYCQPDLSIIPFKLAYNLRPLSSLVLCAFIVASYLVICAFHALRGDKSAKVSLSSNYSIGAALVLLWFFFDLIGSLAGGRFYPHYFLAITPSIAAVSGFAYWSIIGGEFAVGSKAIRASVFALIIGPLLFFQIEDIQTAQTHTKKSQPIIS